MAAGITTHVLDVALGQPAAGMQIELFDVATQPPTLLARTRTNRDGYANAYTNTHANSESAPSSYAYANTNANANAYSHSYAYANTYSYSDSNANSISNTNADGIVFRFRNGRRSWNWRRSCGDSRWCHSDGEASRRGYSNRGRNAFLHGPKDFHFF